MLLHPFTNDLKNYDPQKCVEKMVHIIDIVKQEWASTQMIIFLTTPRVDNIKYHTNGQIINALIKQQLHDHPSVNLIDHGYMLHDGNPLPDLLTEDGVHLSEKGVSQLAANMKRAIHNTLGIETVNSRRSRSRARVTRGFNRKY